MKKKMLIIGIAILLTIGITACGANEPGANILKSGDDTEETGGNTEEQIDVAKRTDDENVSVNNKDQLEYELTEEGIIKPEIAKKIIEETAHKVIVAISNKDAETLSEFVHPILGVRFTPYTYVSSGQDIVFNRQEMKNFFNDRKVYQWGNYDGTGEEIKLTPAEYYEKFIYSEDFINAEKIGYNEVLSFGNMLENQFEVYQEAIVVEYYFSGFNPEYGGLDWKSLRLVFQQHEGKWRLVGIIHNQWTT